MAINLKTFNQANLLLRAIEIGNEILINSTKIDSQTVIAFQFTNDYAKSYLEYSFKSNNLSSSQVRSLEEFFFSFWNDTISEEVEFFWELINKNKLPFERKSPIKELLLKGRFRKVEQWIDLFNNIRALKQSGILSKQFTKEDIEFLNNLLELEEKKRYDLVNKCFKKKKIPSSQYLKFGESMAFLIRCNIISKYFNENEREEIYEIWKST